MRIIVIAQHPVDFNPPNAGKCTAILGITKKTPMLFLILLSGYELFLINSAETGQISTQA